MEPNRKPTKHSVALVIYRRDRKRILIVKRPPDEGRLPNVWGLPAGSLKEGETDEAAVRRAGREKLGVELKIVHHIGEGDSDRGDYILHMKAYEVEIVQGDPQVPQPIPGVTQYVAWRWGEPVDLLEAAQRGSLCSRLYLSSINQHG